MNSRPPDRLDGAQVLFYTVIDDRHTFSGRCRHVVNGKTLGPMVGLAICQYDKDATFYLFGCNLEWAPLTDTEHETLAGAVEQAEFEYQGSKLTWITLS